jgi:iron complex transport system ATP-binding protein
MSPAPLLELRSLALRAGARPAGRMLFGGLSLAIEGGQRWVVLGPNGAGKSSLLAALAGVFEPAAGRVEVDGRALPEWPPRLLAGRRAWCPQFWSDPFAATVLQTAQLARTRGSWWGEALDAAQPDAVVERVIAQLDLVALAGTDIRTLSGGERQRVAVATALLQGAPLLLLDEPASHLDLAHQQMLVTLLMEHATQGGAVFASLHDLNLAWDLASHAVLLDGRGSAWAGPRDTVMTPGLLSAAFGVPIAPVEVCGERRFWIGPRRGTTEELA